MKPEAERQIELPLRKAVQLAWKSMRIRWWRSLLVTAGIVLAIAFLTFMLVSSSMARSVHTRGSHELLNELRKRGVVGAEGKSESQIQMWWMVGIAMLTSFVAILNAMLMSVAERFREIGTMKCLGALDSFVIKLFLLESVFQGVMGTSAGFVIGAALAFGQGFGVYGAETVRLIPGPQLAGFAAICFATGVALTVAGALYPAWRAATMQPVDAMRSEV